MILQLSYGKIFLTENEIEFLEGKEMEFIINYCINHDIKYRMGKELEED